MTEEATAPDAQPENHAAGPTLEEALKQIAALEAARADANDKMLRALAEAENTRRRAERDRQDTAKFSVASFARDMLTVADNLKRALNAITPEQRAQDELLRNLFTGVEATERELQRALEKNGIKKVDPLGQKFDPNQHEVMFETPAAPGVAGGTVTQVIDVGYMIHERLLRPARVGVAKGEDMSEGARLDQQV